MAHPYWYVLLVDDDEDDYYLIREQLAQTQGRIITLTWADTYENAHTLLTNERFDAVLVDYRLGVQTGTELIREMTKSSYPAPFILLTGVGSYEVDVEAMQAGATAYISKSEANSLQLERTIRYAIERKQVEEALRGARDKAQAAEAALQARNEEIEVMTQQLWQAAKLATMGELAASIAHELNNPLQILSLRLENLESQLSDPIPVQKDLNTMKAEIDRMADLVSNLLQFSRSGGQQITSLDIREEIDRTLDLVNNHLINRHISVQHEFSADLPMIKADRQQIRQLFLNLFTNASDAMHRGGTLTIRARTDPERLIAIIEIQDTGIGIAPEYLSKVIQPFFTTKPEGRGTGLGLAICRRIVEEHQGSLDISSPGRDQGTLIQVALPSAIDRGTGFLLETEDGE